MKTKKVRFHEDDEKKKKQQFRTKKSHLNKQESQMKSKKGFTKRQGKPNSNLKKFPKKSLKGKQFRKGELGNTRQVGKKVFGSSEQQKNHSPRNPVLQDPLVTSSSVNDRKGKKRKFSETTLAASEEPKLEEKRIKLHELKPKERKKLRKQKKAKAVFDLSMAAKMIWEVVRRDDCAAEKRENMIAELMKLVKGHVKQLIFAHDTVRVIECVVAVGTVEQRSEIFDEVKGDLISLAKSKYARFLLIKILNYGTKEQKDLVVNSFKGQLVALVKHAEASKVVETAFNDYANAKQRAEMFQEFCGPSFSIFKDENARNLSDILTNHPDQKASILNHMKDELNKIAKKSAIRHSLVHYVLREFLRHADSESRSELIENIRDAAVEILHTKDGARVAMNCLWYGNVKDRKKIVKSMKMHVCKIAKEEHGSLVLIAAFDCVDDTKLVHEIIIKKLCENFKELSDDVHARKVLLYLVCPRDSHFFHPDVVNIIKAGDNNENSKKRLEVRWQELKLLASPLILQYANLHVSDLVKNNATSAFLLGILQHVLGSKKEIFTTLATLLHSPYEHARSGDLHPLEQPALNFLIKKLLQSQSSKERSDDVDVLFSEVLVSSVPQSIMKTWIECNRGAFILLDLLKSGVPSVITRVTEEMKGLHNVLRSKTYKGAELLLTELKKCSVD